MAYTAEQLASMSDEDLLNVDASQLASIKEDETQEEVKTEEVEDDDKATGTVAEEESEDDSADADADAKESEEEEEDADPADEEADDEADNAAKAAKGNEPKADEGKTAAKADADASKQDAGKKDEPAKEVETAAQFHAKITAPFKANGRDMKVETAEEAVQLMQMGANYHKKMQALKPNLQLMKSLETAGLLSQDKIDFLIDVMAKKPEAISKLVKDSGIDPLEITTEKASDYKPTSYRVSDKQIALEEVLGDLKGSEHYEKLLNVAVDTLDEASKQLIADNPTVLSRLHKHIEDGVFDTVWPEVEKRKLLGQLPGLSDLEAYRQVGDELAASGAFAHLSVKAKPQSQQKTPAPAVVEPKPKQAEDDKDRRKKRLAASPTKAGNPTPKIAADINSLAAMSDEEILKLDISKLR